MRHLNITFGDLPPQKSPIESFIERPLRKTMVAEKTEGWIEAGDPIISATFDVATRKLDKTSTETFLALVINVETSDQHEY